MFESETLQTLIEFKWQQYGLNFHLFGFFIHIVYIIYLFVYTNIVYINGIDENDTNIYAYILLIGILYPTVYETIQMLQNGVADYLGDIGNYVDLTYIWGSVIMSFLHASKNPGPYHWVSKGFMIVMAILAIRRTFNFMRVFRQFSPIVTMLQNVIWALRIFMTFYVILILLFSLVMSIIGLGNHQIPGEFRSEYWVLPEGGTEYKLSGDAPTANYAKIGMFFQNFMLTL